VWCRRCWRVWAFAAEVLSQDIEREIGRLPRVTRICAATYGQALNDVLERAFDEAQRFKDEYVSTEHHVPGHCWAERDTAGQLFEEARSSHEAILQALTSVRARNG